MEFQQTDEEGNIPDTAYLSTDIDNVIANNTSQNDLIDNALVDFDKELSPDLYDKKMKVEIKTAKQLTGKQYLLIIPITRFFQNVRNMYILINILNGKSIISLRLIEYFVVNYVLENNTYFDVNKYKQNKHFIIENMFGEDEETPTDTDNNSSGLGIVENKAELTVKEADNIAPITAETREIAREELRTTLRSPNFDNYFLVHDNYKSQLKEYNKKNFDPFCRWNRIRVYYDAKKYFYTTVAQLNFFKWAIENYVLDYILDNMSTIEASMNEYEKAIKLEKKVRKINLLKLNAKNPMETVIDTVTIPHQMTPAAAAVAAAVTSEYEDEVVDGVIRRTKKRDVSATINPDKKSKLKCRKKKEFTKTNRSIIKYDCIKIINFD